MGSGSVPISVGVGLRIPPLYAFRWKQGQNWSFGHSVIHGTTFDDFRSLWRHLKKIPKIINFAILVSELFFRNKYVIIVISIVFDSKWWVTWPFSPYGLKNDQFGHFIGKFIPTSGLMISMSRNVYFWHQYLLSFNLRYRTWHKLIIHRKSSRKL